MRRVGLLVVLSICGIVAWPHAQTKRAMRIDDLIGAVRVSEPALAGDGTRVAYTRTTTVLETGKRNADIWVAPVDVLGPPRPLIAGDGSDTTPHWLPDGRLAFISTRGGAAQVYVAAADGSVARQVTHVAAGVQPPLVVSSDGRRLAFVSDVDPACADEACNARAITAASDDPVKVRELTRLPYRHWDEWREKVRHHVFVVDVDGTNLRDLTPGDFDAPPHFYEDGAIAFSADGRDLAFVSNHDGPDREMWSTNQDVFVVPVAGGAAKKLTPNAAADVQPLFTPDGKSVVVRAQRRAGFESDRWYIDVYDRATGAKRTLFDAPDLSAEEIALSPDGATVWFVAQDHGRANAYAVPIGGGTPRKIASGGAVGGLQVGARSAVYTMSTLIAPADVYRVNVDGSSVQPVSRENASWLGQVDLATPESATVPGAGGTPVQYWVLKPPAFDPSKKYPVVFYIHGGPQGAWEDAWSSRWNAALWAAQGWVIVAPNPRGSTGFGQKFVDEISQDWCGKVMTDLNAVIDAGLKLPYVDPARAGIAGASYGGYAVDWIIGHDTRFKAAVSHDGVFNLESMALATEELWFVDWEFGGAPWSATARQNFARCSPHLSADKIKTPTLVITNEQDFRVPVDQGLQLFTALRRNGTPSAALVFENEGHWVLGALDSRRWHQRVFAWIAKHLATPGS